MKHKIKWYVEDHKLYKSEKVGLNTTLREFKLHEISKTDSAVSLRALMAMVSDLCQKDNDVEVFGFRLKSGERK